MASTQWRIIRVGTYQPEADLILDELHLYSGTSRVDNTATITCTVPLAQGSIGNISDAATSTITIPYTAYKMSAFSINWEFPTPTTVDGVRLRAPYLNNYLSRFELQEFVGGSWERVGVSSGAEWLGANTYSTEPSLAYTIYARWDPTTTAGVSYITLENNNLTTYSAQTSSVRSTISVTSGKIYVELSHVNFNKNCYFGVGLSSLPTTYYPGQNASGWSYNMTNGNKMFNGTSVAYGPALPNHLGLYLDATAGTMGFIVDGVDMGVAFTGITGPFFIAWGAQYTGSYTRTTVNFGETAFVNTPPSGYAGLGIKELVKNTTPTLPYTKMIAGRKEIIKHSKYRGTKKIYGNVYIGGSPDTPTRKLVRLHEQEFGGVVDNTLSDSVSGYYSFDELPYGTYYVTSFDETKTHEGVIDSDIELLPPTPPDNPRSGLPHYDNVRLLLKASSAGTQIVDSSKSVITMKTVSTGTSMVENTEAIKKYGSASMFCPGNSYLKAEDPSSIQWTNGDFVVEGWYQGLSSPTTTKRIWMAQDAMINTYIWPHGYFITSGANVTIGFSQDTSSTPITSTTITLTKFLSEFTHIAFVKKDNNIHIVVDGVPKSVVALAKPISMLAISDFFVVGDGSYNFHGYIDDFCVTMGTSKGYELGFTPAELYAY